MCQAIIRGRDLERCIEFTKDATGSARKVVSLGRRLARSAPDRPVDLKTSADPMSITTRSSRIKRQTFVEQRWRPRSCFAHRHGIDSVNDPEFRAHGMIVPAAHELNVALAEVERGLVVPGRPAGRSPGRPLRDQQGLTLLASRLGQGQPPWPSLPRRDRPPATRMGNRSNSHAPVQVQQDTSSPA